MSASVSRSGCVCVAVCQPLECTCIGVGIRLSHYVWDSACSHYSCSRTQAIHEKIQSLDFTDCRARIKQVDSHATLGNGIVIQVCISRLCVWVGGWGGGGSKFQPSVLHLYACNEVFVFENRQCRHITVAHVFSPYKVIALPCGTALVSVCGCVPL